MPVITEDAIRSLAEIRSDNVITSCYLDVDGGRYVREADYERVFEGLVRKTRHDESVRPAAADLDRIEALVRGGFDRSRVRGVAVFSCVADDLWEVVELPVSVRPQLVANAAPAVGQLEGVVQQSITIGVLVADKVRARVFVFDLDELVEHEEVIDELGRDYDTIGEHDRGGVDHHREEMEHQHLRNAAKLLWSAYQTRGFDHVAIAVPEQLAGELHEDLHPYLQERLRGSLRVEPSASLAVIREAVVELEDQIERDRAHAAVEELRSSLGAGDRAVAGLDDVLDSLADQRVRRLLVSDGYAVEGWQCPACGRLATVGRTCRCGGAMEHVHDVVEYAVDHALTHSCTVEVCRGDADLDVLGRIGALLRY
ncbi:hypothetical protein [Actinospongicola halichondriae]|uniref:baeRF10 domain-containing protein n=1 Tax=Actinospongicola halichondriae TaxID=3236844 RepID=UPI003D37C09E